MEYRIIRHAEGEEREDHKYVARVLLKKGTGKKPNQYRYFYDQKTYKAYLDAQKVEEKNIKSGKLSESISKLFSGKVSKESVNEGKEFLNTLLSNDVSAQTKVSEIIDKGKNFANGYVKSKGDAVVSGAAEVKESISNFVKTALTSGIGMAVASAVYNAIENIQEKIEDKKRAVKEKSEVVEVPTESDETPTEESSEQFPNLDRKDREYTKDEDQELINPNYDEDAYDEAVLEYYFGNEEAYLEYCEENYEFNCSYCTAAYDLRQRGYDVEAMPINMLDPEDGGDDPTYSSEIASWYEDANLEQAADIINRWEYDENESLSSKEIKKIIEHLEKNEDGAYGHLLVYWTGGQGGHDVVWEIENGECIIRDCQTNETYPPEQILERSYYSEFFRCDNLELAPEIERVVRNRS